MAEILLHKITLLADKSSGGTYPQFVSGGQVCTFYNDSTNQVVVRNLSNNNIITSGPILLSNEVIVEPNFQNFIFSAANYQFCNGSTLVSFYYYNTASFPYSIRVETANSFSCTGGVCSLLINDVIVSNATNDASDGSIQVISTGASGQTQYSLSPIDFGSGQSSNAFNGLSAGDYIVYAVDSNNCKSQYSVTVGSSNFGAYNNRYIISYQDLSLNDAKFEIKERDYTGSVQEITSSQSPVRYVKDEKDQFDIFTTIHPSYVIVTIPEITKFGYDHLFTQDSRQFLGVWYRDTGSGYEEKWRGYLTPEVFQTQYNSHPEIELTFVDGLARLEEYLFSNPENTLYSDIDLLRVVIKALDTTELDLPVRVACNMYATSGFHLKGDADDPLNQTFIDGETFYKDGNDPMNLKDSVEKVLKPLGIKLIQWGGYWWLIRIEEQGASFDYREYDSKGVYVTNGTYNPVKYLRNSGNVLPRAVFVGNNASYEILPAAKNIIVNNNLDLRDSILENHDFSRFSNTVFDEWNHRLNGTNIRVFQTFVEDGFVCTFNVNQWGSATSRAQDSYIETPNKLIQYRSGDRILFSFDFAVDIIDKVFPYLILRARVKLGNQYLMENGQWSNSEWDLSFYPSASDGFGTVDIEADLPPTNVTTQAAVMVRIYAYQANSPDFNENFQDGLASLKSLNTTVLPEGTRYSVYRNSTSSARASLYLYELTGGDESDDNLNTIRPNDYVTSTNERVFKLSKAISIINSDLVSNNAFLAVTNRYYYVDNVIVKVLPNGQDPLENEKITVHVNNNFISNYEYEISASDIPQVFISSAKYIYKSLFRFANLVNITTWSRDGVSESNPIQQIIAKVLQTQYSTPSRKISGDVTTHNPNGAGLDLSPIDCLVETQDNNRVYYINGMTIEDKSMTYNVNLVELKAV